MWKLTIDKAVETEYLNKMLPGLIKRIQQWKGNGNGGKQISLLYKSYRSLLLPDWNIDKPTKTDTLVDLLTAKPLEAYNLNERLMKLFVQGYDESDFIKKKIPNKYKRRLRTLERILDYEGQISQSKSNSYWLAEKVGHNTCTYCNRQYTFTISGKNDQQRITRPAFDHWFPKSLFPLLSLNIYNLIPSCTICNSGAKGNTIFHLDTHIHPYVQKDDDPKFKFVPQIADEDEGTWHVVLDRDAEAYPEVDNTIKAFELERLYESHGNLEVKEIMDFAQAYSNSYLQDLYSRMVKELGIKGFSQEEVYRMLFGTEGLKSQFLDRPLSKLKHDILEYLHII